MNDKHYALYVGKKAGKDGRHLPRFPALKESS